MATRLNTVEYPFTQRVTSLAAATRHDFAAETIYLPENTTRTFKSVFIEVTCLQNNTVATNFTSVLTGIKLGAAAFSDVTVTQTVTNSGEINGYMVFRRDVTSYFTTNFGSGTSQTCQIGVQFGGAATMNHTAKLIVTYEYNDADTTRVKTVRIPFDSNLGSLTTSYVEVGTDQVPALTGGSGLLPEGSVVIRQIWFEVHANDNQAGTVDFQHGLRLDAGGSDDLDGLHEAFANASNAFRRIWRPTISDTTVTHKVYSRTTNATSGPCSTQMLCMFVTYEYDASASTGFLHSLLLPFGGDYAISAASSALHRFRKQFIVAEPGTITLKQSGLWLFNTAAAGLTLNVAVGGQTARAYVRASATVNQAGFYSGHRFDSGGAAGSGLSIARGSNTIDIDVYANSFSCRAVSGMIVLNYTSSGKASGGFQTHNKTIRTLLSETTTQGSTRSVTAALVTIPETNYYLSGIGLDWCIACTSGALATRELAFMWLYLQSGELEGKGWQLAFGSGLTLDAEVHSGVRLVGDIRRFTSRFPGDARMGIDPETSRDLAFNFTSSQDSAEVVLTYSLITFAFAKSVEGYVDADGAGLTVEIYNTSVTPVEKLGSVVTTAGGAFSWTWYEDVSLLRAVLQEDSTHYGCSVAAAAS